MITNENVKKMAGLARIELDADEARALTKDLERILEYMETLKEANVEGVEEFSALDVNEFRGDEVRTFDAVSILTNALPHAEHGFASVKKVIEK